MTTQETKNQLEQIIDSNTLSRVLEMISQICYEKEDHINENWQDKETANVWKYAGNRLLNVSDKVGC